MTAAGDGEGVIVGLDLVREIVHEVANRPLVLVVPRIANPLEEQHREDVRLEVAWI
jgi:hypothetical protein